MPHRRNSNLKNQSIPNSQTRNCCEGTYRMQQINPIIPAGKKKKLQLFFQTQRAGEAMRTIAS